MWLRDLKEVGARCNDNDNRTHLTGSGAAIAYWLGLWACTWGIHGTSEVVYMVHKVKEPQH